MSKQCLTPEQRERKRLHDKKYYATHRDKIRAKQKEYSLSNKAKLTQYKKEWAKVNRERLAEHYKEYRAANKVKIASTDRAYQKANKDKIAKRKKEYYRANHEKITQYNREYYKTHKDEIAKYTTTNRSKRAKYVSRRKKTDPHFRLAWALRIRLYQAIKKNYKAGSAVRDLGCSIEEFKTYIEDRFQEGMSWENHGEWHLDHIIPLSAFDLTNRDEFLIACHFTNYQPLWATENLSKGCKIGTK